LQGFLSAKLFVTCVCIYFLLSTGLPLHLFVIFQGEIGRRSGGDNVLEREGHAVSAGFALGLVALGMRA